jgi:DNA-binding IclR family transcriptional regulator
VATAKSKDSPYQVQVLDRAVLILEALAAAGPDLSLFELSERLDLHKSTIHRLLMVLERHHLVEKSPQSGRYGLGLRLFELGNRAVTRLGIAERAHPHLKRLAAETGETAHLCILDEGEVLYLEKVESAQTVRVPSSTGQRNPAHCTAVGKALLAYLPDGELERLVRTRGLRARTRNTITSLAELRRELKLVRERGYAIDDEEIEEGLKCVGAPVRDHSGRVAASLSIAGPAFRVTKAKLPPLAALVTRTAHELSTELGYRPSAGARRAGGRV